MRLRIVAPLEVVIDEDAASIRAADESGSFGILPGHAPFLTSLGISAVGWTNAAGGRRYCAVRHGMVSVTGGQDVAVATREAIPGDDLGTLESTVLARFEHEIEEDRSARFDSNRLQLDAIRRIVSQLHSGGASGGLFS